LQSQFVTLESKLQHGDSGLSIYVP
jgi:hypothetical protein